VTQEPYRNQDCEDSRAHSFCHAKYTHVSQTLWRGLFQKWEMPETLTFHQFLVRVGEFGEYAVLETDDLAEGI
jgi:hypothetical protein